MFCPGYLRISLPFFAATARVGLLEKSFSPFGRTDDGIVESGMRPSRDRQREEIEVMNVSWLPLA
jgi:hypothetical protein